MKNCEFKNKHKCKLNDHNCDPNNCPLLRDPSSCGHCKDVFGTMVCELDTLPCGLVSECPVKKFKTFYSKNTPLQPRKEGGLNDRI